MTLKLPCVAMLFLIAGQCSLRSDQTRTFRFQRGKELPVEWTAAAGSQVTSVAVGGGLVFMATNNDNPRDPRHPEDSGVVMCFSDTGEFKWQALHPRLPKRVNDITQAPIYCELVLDEGRLYYLSNAGEAVCLDTAGFYDGKNNGATNEVSAALTEADFIWHRDLVKEFGVVKRDADDVGTPLTRPLVHKDKVYFNTLNGGTSDTREDSLENPNAPSLVCLNKKDGRLIWSAVLPKSDIPYGQWAAPAIYSENGREFVVFSSGDAACHFFDPENGGLARSVRFGSLLPKSERPYIFFQPPLFVGSTAYFSLNMDFERPLTPGLLAVDVSKASNSPHLIWKYESGKESFLSSPLLIKEALYALTLSGEMCVLKPGSGEEISRFRMNLDWASRFGNLVHRKGLLYVPTESSFKIWDLEAHRELAFYKFPGFYPTTPILVGQHIYIGCGEKIYSFQAP